MKTTYRIDFAEELKKCVRCGQCRYHCPVFIELKGEPAAPRGRLALVQLLQQGKTQPTEELADKLYTCLLCKTCAVNCPSGVITDEIMLAARDHLGQALGESLIKKTVLKGFLTRPGLLQSAFSLLQLYQKTGLHNVLTKSKLIEYLPEKLGAAAKIMPDVSKKPAKNRMPVLTPSQGIKKFRVAYFLGCASNLIYPEIPVAGVEVLSANGCEVITPQNLKCCGMPHLAYGETQAAVELAKTNIQVLLDLEVDAVVTDCATCSSTLKETYQNLFEINTPEYKQALTLSEKVYDLNQFLVGKTGIIPGKHPVKASATYHDPCHLKRVQNVSEEPRELLKAIPGLEFREMKEADRCCGSAGSFSFMHQELSMKILDRKIGFVGDTQAEYVATSCPTCKMQLNYGIAKHNLNARVVHPVQLLAKSYHEKH